MGVHGMYKDRYIIRKYQSKKASSGTYRNLVYKVYGQGIQYMYNSIFMEFDIVCEGCTVDKFANSTLINLKLLADPGVNESVFFRNKAKKIIDKFIEEN